MLPFLRGVLTSAIEKQKQTLFSEKTGDESKPLIANIWEIFVIGMITYFAMSIINSLVQNYLNEQDTEGGEKKDKINKKETKKNK